MEFFLLEEIKEFGILAKFQKFFQILFLFRKVIFLT